jgi:hypothetical protein
MFRPLHWPGVPFALISALIPANPFQPFTLSLEKTLLSTGREPNSPTCEEAGMSSKLSKKFNHRGSGHTAAVRMLTCLVSGFMFVAIAMVVLV